MTKEEAIKQIKEEIAAFKKTFTIEADYFVRGYKAGLIIALDIIGQIDGGFPKEGMTKCKDCPIIGEIPDKHGRIVDLDKVLDWLINEDGRFSMATNAKIDNALKNAPIIMEASDDSN